MYKHGRQKYFPQGLHSASVQPFGVFDLLFSTYVTFTKLPVIIVITIKLNVSKNRSIIASGIKVAPGEARVDSDR